MFQIEQPVIAQGASISQVIPIGDVSKSDGAAFQCPAALTGTTITIKVSDRVGEAAADHVDALVTANSGAISTFTFVANKSFNIPDEVFNHRSMVFVSNSSEAAARTFALNVKPMV